MTVSGQSDSVKLPDSRPEYDFLYRELFNFDPASTFGSLAPDLSSFLSKDFSGPHTPLTLDSGQPLLLTNYRPSNHFALFLPSVNLFSVQHAAVYRLNDKFILSGSSFSAPPVFNLPLSNPAFNDLNIRGASMFLQYKVSKNIQIGGGISITDYR